MLKSSVTLFARLEEVAGLLAQIETTPYLPFAHLASQQAALATHALETELVGPNDVHLDIHPVIHPNVNHLEILRLIAVTTIVPALDPTSKSLELMWLLLETETDVNKVLQYACEHGHTEIVQLLLNMPLERGVDFAEFDN